MDILLSVRLIGYLGILYALVVAFFALIEVTPLTLSLIAGAGLLILAALAVARHRHLRRHRSEA